MGDSGGPLVSGTTVIGIVSHGDPDCKRVATSFTKVYTFAQWINEKANRNYPTKIPLVDQQEETAAIFTLTDQQPIPTDTSPSTGLQNNRSTSVIPSASQQTNLSNDISPTDHQAGFNENMKSPADHSNTVIQTSTPALSQQTSDGQSGVPHLYQQEITAKSNLPAPSQQTSGAQPDVSSPEQQNNLPQSIQPSFVNPPEASQPILTL